jgi:hypothetical protein
MRMSFDRRASDTVVLLAARLSPKADRADYDHIGRGVGMASANEHGFGRNRARIFVPSFLPLVDLLNCNAKGRPPSGFEGGRPCGTYRMPRKSTAEARVDPSV